jgi:hypothetical protein
LLSLGDDNDDSFGSSFGRSNAVNGVELSQSQKSAMENYVKSASLVRGLTTKSPVLSSDILNVSVAHDYRAYQGRLALSVYNKSSFEVQQLQAHFEADGVLIFKQQGLSTKVDSGEESTLQIAVDCMKPFSEMPKVTLSFICRGNSYHYIITLPIAVSSFCEPLPMDKTTYMTRWKAITAEGTENQVVFSSGRPVDVNLLNFVKTTLFPGLKLGFAEGLDSEKTATGSCTFLTGTSGADGKRIAVGALMRLEADPANGKFRVTVRATHPTVSLAFKNFIVHQLS